MSTRHENADLATPSGTRPTVVIIEDDTVAAEAFALILGDEGYHVVTAHTAEAGVHALTQVAPSAVLIDLHLPLADGLAALKQMRALPHCGHVGAAIVTGDYFVDETVTRVLDALGARLYFKPLWDDDLLRLLRILVADTASASLTR